MLQELYEEVQNGLQDPQEFMDEMGITDDEIMQLVLAIGIVNTTLLVGGVQIGVILERRRIVDAMIDDANGA